MGATEQTTLGCHSYRLSTPAIFNPACVSVVHLHAAGNDPRSIAVWSYCDSRIYSLPVSQQQSPGMVQIQPLGRRDLSRRWLWPSRAYILDAISRLLYVVVG